MTDSDVGASSHVGGSDGAESRLPSKKPPPSTPLVAQRTLFSFRTILSSFFAIVLFQVIILTKQMSAMTVVFVWKSSDHGLDSVREMFIPNNNLRGATAKDNDEGLTLSQGSRDRLSEHHQGGLTGAPEVVAEIGPDHQDQGDQPPAIYDKLVDRSHRVELTDQDRTLAFVHMGKSGGSPISLLLQNGCISAADGGACESDRWRAISSQTVETAASKRIQFSLNTRHVASGNDMAEYYSRVKSVVVVLRDPLERFVSAFLSRAPQNIDRMEQQNMLVRLRAEREGVKAPIWAQRIHTVSEDAEEDQIHRATYEGCFPSANQLAKCVDPTNAKNNDLGVVYSTTIRWMQTSSGLKEREFSLNHSECRDICREIVTGRSDYIPHLKHNYEAFFKDLPSETEVMGIRTNYLWDDFQNINTILGSKTPVTIPGEETVDSVNTQARMPVQNNLDAHGQSVICEYLKNEIQIYIDLLNRAVNLSDEDVRGSLKTLQANCPAVVDSLV